MNVINLLIKLSFELVYYFTKLDSYENIIIRSLKHISEYNIIFVKIFQWIWMSSESSDNNYITPKIEDEIHSYTNNTPYVETDIDYKNLLDIYIEAHKKGDKFELASSKPINSGSISLIFKAKLNDKDIVVKVLRKNIKSKLEDGINLLVWLENFLYKIPLSIFNAKMFEKNKSHILNQINFVHEAENLSLFHKNFKNSKYAITPSVYTDYTISNPNVILMSTIEGKYSYELNNEELNKYKLPFMKFVLNSLFTKHIFHCDLHQGNILFMESLSKSGEIIYKVGIIDMGMVTKMSIDEVDFMYIWLNGLFNDKFDEFINYAKREEVSKTFYEENHNNPECLNEIYQLHKDKKIFVCFDGDEFAKDVHLFLSIFKKYNCRISARYNFFLLALIPIMGLMSKFGPDSENKNIKNYLIKMSNNSLLD